MCGILHAVVFQQGLSIVVTLRIDDKLCIVRSAKLRRIGCMKTRRRSALERCHRHHAAVFAQNMLQTVGNGSGALERRAVGKVNLNGKLVALGRRHHLLRQL